jgi:hypothetical protein
MKKGMVKAKGFALGDDQPYLCEKGVKPRPTLFTQVVFVP